MRISSILEFRDRATTLLRSEDPVLVTRRGRIAGVFFPWRDATLPVDLRRELFMMLSSDIARQLKRKRISEREVLEDFDRWRKARRAARGRR